MNFILLLLLILLSFNQAYANDPFGIKKKRQIKVFKKKKTFLKIKGSIDTRFISAGEAISSQEGGEGITRYGNQVDINNAANSTQKNEKTRSNLIKVPQAFLGIEFDNKKSKFVFESTASDHKDYKLSLIQSYIQKNTSMGEFSFGIIFPEISYENEKTFWQTTYTLTPSVINTWYAEELRPIQINYKYGYKGFYGSLAIFSGADSLGKTLSWRGWASHDKILGLSDSWNLTNSNRLNNQAVVNTEIDQKLGHIITLGYKSKDLSIMINNVDNNADSSLSINNAFAWHTNLNQLAIRAKFGLFQFVTQIMSGKIIVNESKGVDNSFSSSYYMLNLLLDNLTFSIRSETFSVVDHDKNTEKNDNNGNVLTFATIFKESKNISHSVEVVLPKTNMIEGAKVEDPDDNLIQYNIRFRF